MNFLSRLILIVLFFLIGINFSFAQEETSCTCVEKFYFNGNSCAEITDILLCPDNYNPVCGCDGKVYANECNAYINGIKSYTDGFCSLNENFQGRWKSHGLSARLDIKKGNLSGVINRKNILQLSNHVMSTKVVIVTLNLKNNLNKKVRLELVNPKELKIIFEDGNIFKAKKII